MRFHKGPRHFVLRREARRTSHLVRCCAVAAAWCGLAASPASAQSDSESGIPAVFEILAGDWHGSGELLGRAAVFDMRWDVGPDGFVRLSFANAFAREDGGSTPVLEARATYLLRGMSAMGVWLDDRPQRLTLEGIATDTSFVVNWTADAERGRTEYVVRSSETVVVRDYVFSEGSERLFAEAVYRRRSPAG